MSQIRLGFEPSRVASVFRTLGLRSGFWLMLLVAFSSRSLPIHAQDEPAQNEPAQKKEEKKEEPAAEKISYDVEKLQELNLPPAVIKELSKGTRSKRDPDDSLKVQRTVDLPKPSLADIKKFEDFRRIGGPEYKSDDLPLVETVVKWQVYSMAEPNAFANNALGRKNRDQIENAFENPAAVNPKFLPVYKEMLGRYLPDLLNLHLWPRVNAMRLLAKMRDEKNIPLFAENIRDDKQHDGVKYWAIKGIQYLGERRLIRTIQLETEAVGALLDKLEGLKDADPATRRIMQQAIVQALGAVGRPTRVAFEQDAAVAIALLRIVRDPNLRRWDRNEAAVALANLQIPRDLDYNFQYVAHEIALFAADAAAAALRDPAIDDLRTHLFLLDCFDSLDGAARKDSVTKVDNLSLADKARQHPLASQKGDSTYIRTISEPIKQLVATSLKVYKYGDPRADDVAQKLKRIQEELPKSGYPDQLKQLLTILQQQPPRSMKLTPKTEELGPPPAIVGPKSPAAPSEEANDERAKASQDNSTTGPGL